MYYYERKKLITKLAREPDQGQQICPICNQLIAIASGLWTQHTDPKSGARGQPNRQCSQALRPYELPAALAKGEDT